MPTDAENFLWSIRDLREGTLPHNTRFTHRNGACATDLEKKGANAISAGVVCTQAPRVLIELIHAFPL